MTSTRAARIPALALASLGAVSCSPSAREVSTGYAKQYLVSELARVEEAARTLRLASPSPAAQGWDAQAIARDVPVMQTAWLVLERSWVRVAFAVREVDPALAASIDGSFDAQPGTRTDDAPFDAIGHVGIHAIERVLWATTAPASLLGDERADGVPAPHYPATVDEAIAFRDGLARQLLVDLAALHEKVLTATVDPVVFWHDARSLVISQATDAGRSPGGETTSPYSQAVLLDLTARADGLAVLVRDFRPWLANRGADATGAALEVRLTRARGWFDALDRTTLVTPASWQRDAPPTDAQWSSAYGRLVTTLQDDARETDSASLAGLMAQAERVFAAD